MSIKFGFETGGDDVVSQFADQVKGRTFLITGPSQGGIGAETAVSLARAHPKALILIGRSLERVQPIIDAIRAVDAAVAVKFFETDLSLMSSVRKTAQTILDDASIPAIDVVINNAAVMAIPFELTAEGLERQLASGHLGHFVLTNHLLPKILASPATPGPRIINVSSIGNKAGGIRWTDPNFAEPESYNAWTSYGQTKTANVLFSIALNQRYRRRGLRSLSLHPGSIRTNLSTHVTRESAEEAATRIMGGVEGLSRPRKTLQQGCATTLRAALDPALDVHGEDGADGVYLVDCNPSKEPVDIAPWALDPEAAKRLWSWSEELVGEQFKA